MPSWDLCDLRCATHPSCVDLPRSGSGGGSQPKKFWEKLGKPPGWMIRTQGLVTRGDLTAKRKESSGLFYCLPRAVEAAWGTLQTAAPLSWGHKRSVTVPREDIPPKEITSQSLLPALCISGV